MALALTGPPVCATEIRLEGGRLELAGQLEVAALSVGAGSVLQGAGSIAGSGLIAGRVSPGVGATEASGLTFAGDLVFQAGSEFECQAFGHETIDRLVVGGAVQGACAVSMIQVNGAIPLHQVIIAGGADSDYGLFGASPTNWTLAAVPVGDLEVTERTGDSDADGLPDWWEYDHFFDRTGAGPDDHGDGDIFTNWQEWLAGTDPTDADSFLRILSVVGEVPTRPVITWSSVAGRTYSLYRATGSAANPYELVSDGIAGETPASSHSDEVPPGDARAFYQVRVRP